MIDKEKCRKWCNVILELMEATKALTDNEAEYIMQNLKIGFAELKLEELLKKEENK